MRRPVVLVFRGRDAFSDKLIESGCEVINLELIKIEPIADLGELATQLAYIENLDGLFFTSPYAATAFLDYMERSGERFAGKLYVLGDRTRNVFENAGVTVEYRDVNTAAEMIEAFGLEEFAGKRLMFVRGDRSMRTIPELLSGKAEVKEAIVYKTVEKTPDPEFAADLMQRIKKGEIDWMCFFSPSGIEAFAKTFDTGELHGIKTAAIGNTTAARAKELGLRVDLISQKARAEDFAADLIDKLPNN